MVSTAACAAAKSTADGWAVVVAVRHVAVAASETREVDVCTTAGESKSVSVGRKWASPCARSAQIKDAASVHQESLIR